MSYLVSGATGFVGRELCRQLSEGERPFTGFSRSGGQLPGDVTAHTIDLEQQTVPPALLQGVETVFHLAGVAHQWSTASTYTQVNHLATVALAKSAAAAGVRCFIYLSSVKAMGPPVDGGVRHEAQCTEPTSAYGRSKLAAEEGLRALCDGGDMSLVILRPALVYGAGAKGNLRTLRRAVRAGMPRPPELGGRSMVAVGDLADLMIHIAAHPPPGSHTWIVCDGQRYSSRRIYELMRSADGKGRGVSWLPLWAWRLAASLADGLRNRGVDSTFLKLFGSELYSSAALLEAVAWQPQLQLSDVVADMMTAPEESSS